MSLLKWSEIMGHRGLGTVLLAGTPARQRWLETTYPPTIPSNTAVGVEIECENVRGDWAPVPHNVSHVFERTWISKEDGSLRNHGTEFVTRAGMTAAQASQALVILSEVFRHAYPNITANNRTGVHIHLNCLDKTIPQLVAFCTAYCLVEKSLFAFSGGRTENIFCVPVRTSHNVVSKFIRAGRKNPEEAKLPFRIVRNSPKYLAFNIGALTNFGTIELRHAQGTREPHTVIPWLQTLVHLFDYATNQELEPFLERIRLLNTNSQYDAMMRALLPDFFIRQVGSASITADMVQGSTFVKMALIEPEDDVAPQRPDEIAVDTLDDFDDPPREAPRAPRRNRPNAIIADNGRAAIVPRDLPDWPWDTHLLGYDATRSIFYLYPRQGAGGNGRNIATDMSLSIPNTDQYTPWIPWEAEGTKEELLAAYQARAEQNRQRLWAEMGIQEARRPRVRAPQMRIRND